MSQTCAGLRPTSLERTASPKPGFSPRARRRHESGSEGFVEANRAVTGARIAYPDWPFITARLRLSHWRKPATYVGIGSGTLLCWNAA
jgi:hypothetical protein